MIWVKLSTPKQKPLYLCSLYRIPNSDSRSILSLSVSLQKLHQMVPSPRILLAGDLNLPSVTWSDGSTINPCPIYGHGINQLFLDTINEYGLEQLITQPTRGNNILDLVFSTQPNIISNLQIIPGISDHEAIFFHLGLATSLPVHETKHPILLYHKGNLNGLKPDMLEFQNQLQFMSTDPYSHNIETNWLRFKLTFNTAINKNIPQTTSKTQKYLLWLNSAIRKKMQKRKHLYNKAKSTGSEETWLSYRKIRNEITKEINETHKVYQEKLFHRDTNSNHKNFWRYIRRLRRDNTGVAPLKIISEFPH